MTRDKDAYREVTVVVPMYRTAAYLPELLERLDRAVPNSSLVLIDDCCPEGSAEVAARIEPRSLAVTIVRSSCNLGQHGALHAGMRLASTTLVAAMDADLQDPPEMLPDLVAVLRDRTDIDVVCAARGGDYTTGGRRTTARLYRGVARALSGGRIPPAAGSFLVARRAAITAVEHLDDPLAPLVPALAVAGARMTAIPGTREARSGGGTGYRAGDRIRLASRGLVTLTPFRRVLARSHRRRIARRGPRFTEVRATRTTATVEFTADWSSDAGKRRSSHNDRQIQYFTNRPVPRMVVAPGETTRYVQRHLERVMAAAELRTGERVLDVGCGPGKYTVALHRSGLTVEGLDLTPKLIEDLHAAAPEIPAHIGDLLDPPPMLTGFDAVTGFFVLHHLTDLEAAFCGVARLLRPGGRAVFCEPNAWFPGYYAQVALTPGMTFQGEPSLTKMRTGPLRRAAGEAGFTQITVERFGAVPPALANRPWGRAIEGLLEHIPGWSAVAAFQVFTARLP